MERHDLRKHSRTAGEFLNVCAAFREALVRSWPLDRPVMV
jgi:hypothetical protein